MRRSLPREIGLRHDRVATGAIIGANTGVAMATGWVYHELYMWHDTGRAAPLSAGRAWLQAWEHYENPETKRRFRNLVEVAGLFDDLVALKPRMATVDEILRFHTRPYVESIRALSAGSGGNAGEATPFGPGSFEIALLAAGGTITAVDAVLDGRVRNAYALVRPPGHHAEADRGRGFCIFGNVVVAILHARATRGLGRVAVVDWDVHHGNGTQKAFYADPAVLTISIHQDCWYPAESGAMDERGEGPGLGSNINIPLPPGSGHGAYLAAVERVVVPALRAFRPELIVVPSGFDGSIYDPLGRMMAYSETYRAMTRTLMGAADELCAGRLVLSHEGGYAPLYVPFCGLAVLEELSGVKTAVNDPMAPRAAAAGGQELQPHQDVVIRRAESLTSPPA
jgi:acetoin utilization deacetylase AcuC-like enzyme